MILIILLIIRLPALIYGYPLLLPELTWQLVGEKMNGGFILYKDIWTVTEPFSAGTYYLLDLLFGKSQFIYQFFSLILVFIQAIVFNFVLSINNLYSERTYVPALLYVVFSSLFVDFYTLSPPLLGITFIILAVHFVLFQIRTSEDDENLFYTGVLIAIGSLFYFPLFVFLLLAILSFALFTGTSLRRYFLLLAGFVLPFTIVGVYYFLRDGLHSFLDSLYLSLSTPTEILVSGKLLGVVLAIPVAMFFISIFIIYIAAKYINYQYVTIRIFAFWIVLSVGTLYLARTVSIYHLFVFVPAIAFFTAHFFLLIKMKLVRELIFLAVFFGILGINYGILYGFAFKKNPVKFDEMQAKQVPQQYQFKDKKLLVLGKDRSFYQNNHLATPYLNWDLAQKHFKDLNNYKSIAAIYENFVKDLPEVIIDENNLVPTLFEHMPSIKEKYQKEEGKNVYILTNHR